MKIPTQIRARKEVTYSTEGLMEYLDGFGEALGGVDTQNEMSDLLDMVLDYAVEDLASSHVRIRLFDEDGNEIMYEEILGVPQ